MAEGKNFMNADMAFLFIDGWEKRGRDAQSLRTEPIYRRPVVIYMDKAAPNSFQK